MKNFHDDVAGAGVAARVRLLNIRFDKTAAHLLGLHLIMFAVVVAAVVFVAEATLKCASNDCR